MNRREYLFAATGAGMAGVAGCASSGGDNPPRPSSALSNSRDESFSSYGNINRFLGVNNASVSISLENLDWPREATLELHAEIATEETPAGDWAYDDSGDIRPVLNYPDGHEQFISKKRVDNDYVGDDTTVNFDHQKMPAGVPIQYQVYLRDHLNDEDDSRRHIGTTPQVVRHPGDNKYTVSPGAKRHTDLRDRYSHREDSDGNHHVTVIGGTNNTQYHTPRHDDIPNRDPGHVRLGIHKRGAFERLWAIDYTVTADEFETAHEHNKDNYTRSFDSPREGEQVDRMFQDYLHGNSSNGSDETLDPIRRVAEQLASRAEQLGLDTPEEQLRLVMDLVQWLPYETDDERIDRGVPRVQHPAVTLARTTGDCEDKTMLLAALLYQDPFPDYKMWTYYWENEQSSKRAHRGLAIKSDPFTVDTGGPTATNLDEFSGIEPGDYTYVEATYPAAIGQFNERNGGLLLDQQDFPGY